MRKLQVPNSVSETLDTLDRLASDPAYRRSLHRRYRVSEYGCVSDAKAMKEEDPDNEWGDWREELWELELLFGLEPRFPYFRKRLDAMAEHEDHRSWILSGSFPEAFHSVRRKMQETTKRFCECYGVAPLPHCLVPKNDVADPYDPSVWELRRILGPTYPRVVQMAYVENWSGRARAILIPKIAIPPWLSDREALKVFHRHKELLGGPKVSSSSSSCAMLIAYLQYTGSHSQRGKFSFPEIGRALWVHGQAAFILPDLSEDDDDSEDDNEEGVENGSTRRLQSDGKSWDQAQHIIGWVRPGNRARRKLRYFQNALSPYLKPVSPAE